MRSAIKARRGFTLIELAVVVLVIGLIIAFILTVGFSGVEQARLRSTQSLITKLEVALNDRMAALLTIPVKPNGAHRFLASVNPDGYAPGSPPLYWGLQSSPRAEVIAMMDYIRMEVPDVFYIQNTNPGAGGYLINFAGLPYSATYPPPAYGPSQSPFNYVLPLGNRVSPGYTPAEGPPRATYDPIADLNPDGAPQYAPYGDGNGNFGPGAFVGLPGMDQEIFGGVSDRGIYGASFSARAAIHKAIGYGPEGTNGADDDGDLLIDEHDEGMIRGDATAVARFIANHTHETARSEMLYALLVEGTGPLGNVFSRGDFTDAELKDTDDDGLLEFVDAWGKPLQFYRWPIFYPADGIQLGSGPYGSTVQVRETFPVDPNKRLMAPDWWVAGAGAAGPAMNPKARMVQSYFTCLVDPNWGPSGVASTFWDITGYAGRRSFAAKFLILSAGPDKEYGVRMVQDSFIQSTRASNPDLIAVQILGDGGDPGAGVAPTIGENWASFTNGYPLLSVQATGIVAPPDEALDNLSNLDLQSASGGVR